MSGGILGGLVVLEMSLAGVVSLFGIGGNILTIFVLRAPNLRNTSTAFYFTALAAVDILVLLIAPTIKALSAAVYKDDRLLRDAHPVLCKAHLFLTYSTSQISAWILVAVTLDRMIWVLLPFEARRYCTIKSATVAVLLIVCIICAINCRHLYYSTLMLKRNSTRMHCTTEDKFIKDTYVTYVDPALVTIGPFLVMIIANLLIIRKLRQMKADRERKLHKKTAKMDKSNLTKMLLCTSIFYLVSSLPYLILMLVLKEKRDSIVKNFVLLNVVYVVQVCAYTLFIVNYAIHFLLYCLAGPTFKAEAFRLLGIRQGTQRASRQQQQQQQQQSDEVETNGATLAASSAEEAVELIDNTQPAVAVCHVQQQQLQQAE